METKSAEKGVGSGSDNSINRWKMKKGAENVDGSLLISVTKRH